MSKIKIDVENLWWTFTMIGFGGVLTGSVILWGWKSVPLVVGLLFVYNGYMMYKEN